MDSPDISPAPATETPRPAPRRRKAAARPKTAAARGAAPKKRAAARRPAAAKASPEEWKALLSHLASAASSKLVRLGKNGADSARRALQDVRGLSKKTARRLARDWQAMSPRRRVQLVATLAAALGAAAVPLVTRKLKNR